MLDICHLPILTPTWEYIQLWWSCTIANPIIQLRQACRLEIINQKSYSIRTNPVLHPALSVSISSRLFCTLEIYLQSNTLDFRWSGKFRCEKQRTGRATKKVNFYFLSVYILIIIYYLNNYNEMVAAIQSNKLQ